MIKARAITDKESEAGYAYYRQSVRHESFSYTGEHLLAVNPLLPYQAPHSPG